MGNVLESDSSSVTDENENSFAEDKVVVPERTAGDGMDFTSSSSGEIVAALDPQVGVGLTQVSSSSRSPDLGRTGLDPLQLKDKAKSPRQLPSKELLIPVIAPKLEGKGFVATTGEKQKQPKFVPYEPYSCATRPINGPAATHTRMPSDASQSSLPPITSPLKEEEMKASSSSPYSPSPQHHASATLTKERLKMVEKEVADLQAENARLKRLLVDSIAGVQDHDLNANHGNSESENVENLNDELGVLRSKFLSSCVLVEQLTKNGQESGEVIAQAVDIIRDLKNTSPTLTQRQYEEINEWLKRAKGLEFRVRGYHQELES